jgi:hypothetical protein
MSDEMPLMSVRHWSCVVKPCGCSCVCATGARLHTYRRTQAPIRHDGALRVSTRTCSGELDRQDPEIGTENVNGYARALFPHSGLNPSTAIGDPVYASGATSAWSSELDVNGKWQV